MTEQVWPSVPTDDTPPNWLPSNQHDQWRSAYELNRLLVVSDSDADSADEVAMHTFMLTQEAFGKGISMTKPTPEQLVELKKKNVTLFEQDQVNYVTLSPKDNQACANCLFYRSTGYDGVDWPHCHIVACYPEPIEPTGYCDRWEAKPTPPEPEAVAVEIIADSISDLADAIENSMVVQMDYTPTLAERLQKSIDRVKSAIFPPKEMSSFEVHKDANGVWHWWAVHTNAFEDREKEILAEKAHENYIRRVDMKLVPLPELWTWHLGELSKHGQADMVFGVGKMVAAVGHFDDTPEAQKTIEFYRKNRGKIKLSHGFTAPTWAFKDGVYEVYNTFEISTLPPEAACNPYTSFEEVKTMQIDDKKRKWLEGLYGKEVAEKKIADMEQHSKSVEALGVKYKDFADVGDPAAPGETPAEVPADVANLSKAFLDTVETQGEILRVAGGIAKKQDALEKELAGYKKEVSELRALVNAGPRSAAHDSATGLSDEASAEKIKELPTQTEVDPLWGVPMKKPAGT